MPSRNGNALNEIAAECRAKYDIDTEVIVADLSRPESVDNLIKTLRVMPYRFEVLVNNAGFGIHGDFATTDLDRNIALVNLQLTAAMKLTRAVLPGMIERRRGRILNVASVYSFSPVPFQSVYGACKSFLLSFSTAIQNELDGTGVTVTVFCPGVTQTEFRSRAGIGQKRQNSGMTAETAARIACASTLAGKHIVIPGFINRLYVLAARLLPVQAVPRIVRFINKHRGQSHS